MTNHTSPKNTWMSFCLTVSFVAFSLAAVTLIGSEVSNVKASDLREGNSVSSTSSFDHQHAAWTELLQTYLDDRQFVRYASWQKNQKDLDSYLQKLQSVTYATYQKWSPDEKKAFLINAYNAFTVKLILKNYPVKSIKKIGGFFTKPWSIEFFSLLDGKIKSLDPIEHEWLRKKPELKDARVHAAVNCASWSCPRLQKTAFTAKGVEQQLDQATKQWMADKELNRYQPAQHKAELSKIFDWFEEDFGGNEAGVAAFVRKYGPSEASAALSGDFDIDYLSYDWSLNEAQ